MGFRRSWSRRISAVLSAMMIISSASPVTVPVMAAEDIITDTQQEVTMDEVDATENTADDINAQVTEEGSPLTSEEDVLTDTEPVTEPEDGLAPVISNELLVDDTEDTDELAETTGLVEGSEPLIEEPDMASEETYSGSLVFDTVSAGIVRKIGYRFDSETSWNEIDITSDGIKEPINFTGVKQIEITVTDQPNENIIYYSETCYWVNCTVGTKMTKLSSAAGWSTATFNLSDCGFTQNGVLKANIYTAVHKDYKKKGNLIVHVASENKIAGTDKVISINNVLVQLGNYAIAYDASGNMIPGNYREDAKPPFEKVSDNHIGVAGYGGTITLPYWFAKEATISINDTSAESGNDENGTRYAYTIGDEFFYSEKSNVSDENKKGFTFELAEGLNTDTHIYVGVKQVSFDPEVKFSTVSNNIITGFEVEADDGWGHKTPYSIDASLDTAIKTKEFKKARKLCFDYDKFHKTATASAEYKRDSGNDENWVYRIDYTDKNGKQVSRSLFNVTDRKTFEIEIDDNDRFPEEIKVSAIPKVKVTLSANGTKKYNRNVNDVFDEFRWEDENGNNTWQSVTGGKCSFWVEPGRTVWIKEFKGSMPCIFPYIEEALPLYKGENSLLEFTLPEIKGDRVFEVSFYEFDLEDSSLITVTNGVRNDDGKPGQAVVSINGFGGYAAGFQDIDPKSQLLDHRVLGAQIPMYIGSEYYAEKQLEVNIKMDQTDAFEYTFDRINYDHYDYADQEKPPVELKRIKMMPGDAGTDYKYQYYEKFKVSKDAQGNQIATVYIPARWVVFNLIKDGKFNLTVSEHETRRKSQIALSEGTSGTIKTASVQVDGEYRYGINRAGSTPSGFLPYGSKLSLKAEPANGYKLVSVDIVCPTNSDNNKTITDAKELAEFEGDNGYSYTLKEGITVTFNTEPVYCVDLGYKTGDDKPRLQNGKYIIDHKRPVIIRYKKGNAAPAAYNCDILIGSQKITSNEGISKSGDIYTVDASKGDLAGKNVTFKFYTGDGSKTDQSLRTIVLAFDKANTGVKFGLDKYAVPLGAEKEIPVSITGSYEALAVFASDKTYDKTGLDIKLDVSKKKLIFKSTNESKADIYTINIVNPNDNTVIYGSVKIELETATVKAAAAPIVQIIGTTNRGVTVGFRAQKIDTNIKGLYYELKIVTKEQKKGYFRTSRGVEAGDKIYVPVTTSNMYVDMFTTTAASGAAYAGDTDAVFVATARLVQRRSNDTVIVASDNWSSEKNGTFGTKEGERYETKLKLKKISKGAIYNTMNYDNAYKIGVVYSKKTAIQRLDKTKLKLLMASGEEVSYPAGKSMDDYLKIEDDYTISFYPGGTGSVKPDAYKLKLLAPGTYMIKAYALEPFNSFEVSASIKVKVEKGISDIDLYSSTGVIYKKPGKAVSLKLDAKAKTEDYFAGTKVVFSEFATNKVRYEIVDEEKYAGLIKISKNGRLTINKKFEPDNTELKVRVTADDFTRAAGAEEIFSEKIIKIRSSYGADDLILAYSKEVQTDTDTGEYYFNKSIAELNRLEQSHYLSELCNYEKLTGDGCWEYVPQFWITVYERNKTEGKNCFVPVKFKVSGAGRLIETKKSRNTDSDGAYATCARIQITDVDKDIKITAEAVDNSGRKVKDYKVRVKSVNGKLGVFIADGYNKATYDSSKVLNWDFGNTDQTCDSYALERDGVTMLIGSEFDNEKTLNKEFSAVKYKISSVKGGRISKINFYQSKIYSTADQTTFTVTDLTAKKDYKVTINNKGYVDKNKKTKITASNSLYDAKKGKKTVDGQIYSHLDFSATNNYSDYDSVPWNTVKFHVDTAEDNQYVMVEVVLRVRRVDGVYKVVTKPLGDCINTLMATQSEQEKMEGRDEIIRNGVAYPIKLTGKDFTVDFYDRTSKKFDIAPGSYKLIITPVRREKMNKYRILACPATVTLKVVAPPKADIKPGSAITFGNSEGTVTKGTYSNFLASPVYKEQGILYKALKNINNDGKMNGFADNFKISDQRTGKIEYVGSEPIGIKDKDRNTKLHGWLILEYQQVDGTVVEKPIKVKINTKGEVRKK